MYKSNKKIKIIILNEKKFKNTRKLKIILRKKKQLMILLSINFYKFILFV